jgi:hypothetical protein
MGLGGHSRDPFLTHHRGGPHGEDNAEHHHCRAAVHEFRDFFPEHQLAEEHVRDELSIPKKNIWGQKNQTRETLKIVKNNSTKRKNEGHIRGEIVT